MDTTMDMPEIAAKINHFILELYGLKKKIGEQKLTEIDQNKVAIVLNLIKIYNDEKLQELVKVALEPKPRETERQTGNDDTRQDDDDTNSNFEFDTFGEEEYEIFINRAYIKLTERGNFARLEVKRNYIMNIQNQ